MIHRFIPFLCLLFCRTTISVYLKNKIHNSILNSNAKMCKNCKFFVPQNMKEGEIPIGDYYGKCSKFKYTYFVDNKEYEIPSDITEEYDNKFALYCRMNDELCGAEGKHYEKK